MEEEGAKDIAQAGADVTDSNAVYSLEDRQFIVEQLILVLGEVAYGDIMSPLDYPVMIHLAKDHPCEGCLSFAVAPHEGNFFTSFDLQRDLVKHQVAAVAFRGFVGLNHNRS